MTVVISMLRGVNVGGHHKIKMDALRALYVSLGLHHPQTYVQSGNVIFTTAERNLVRLARRIENGIEQSFGFRPDVMLRTASEMRDVVAGNPFATRQDIEPGKLLVNFLAAAPSPEARRRILQLQTDPEQLRLAGRELYIYYPHGVGRSKLSTAVLERTLQTSSTGRNWNSVTKMLALAEALAR